MPNLKIVSYNIHLGLEAETIVKNIQQFAAQGVDIFCLQEFWLRPADLETLLREDLGSQWQITYTAPQVGPHDYGECILWKKSALEAASFEILTLPLLPKAKTWEKAWIRVNGFHNFIAQRGALVGNFNWNGQLLRITNVHLDWQGGLQQRTIQLAYVRDYLVSQPKVDREIICGDFNSLGIFNKAGKAKTVLDILGNRFYDACRTPEVTCPPFQCLDHIFIDNFQAVNFQTYKLSGSDHFPVFANLTV